MNTGYSVFRFGLQRSNEGKLTQQVQNCGKYPTVEGAFATAREAALREWQEALAMPDGDVRVKNIRINDTEWGYDLKRDHLTIARFWVHDGRPSELV
jgi:hypothetical protein